MKKHLLEAAERGDAEAQFNLGIIYENGLNDSR
jgi:TPR repeat protein